MSDYVKIRFELLPDDGYPPVGVETLNALKLNEGRFLIKNAPFFIQNISYADIVEARENENGGYDFVKCLESSDFNSISIILMNNALDVELMDFFRGFESIIEYGEFGSLRMLAVAIPNEISYSEIKKYLDTREAEGLISYSELALV